MLDVMVLGCHEPSLWNNQGLVFLQLSKVGVVSIIAQWAIYCRQ